MAESPNFVQARTSEKIIDVWQPIGKFLLTLTNTSKSLLRYYFVLTSLSIITLHEQFIINGMLNQRSLSIERERGLKHQEQFSH